MIKIPEEILKASLNNDLILFIGSGFSKPLGFMDWNQLALKAIDEFLVDYPKVSVLRQCLKLEVLDEIAIFDALFSINQQKIESIIQEANNINISQDDLENHKLLWEISSRIITTNYDKTLNKAKPFTSIPTISHNYKREIANNFSKQEWLYHIHGVVDDITNCIIFTKNYVELYSKNNPAIEQLKSIFQNKTILFIGFSMKDKYVANVLENLNIVFENKNNNKRFIVLDEKESPTQSYLTKLELKSYSMMSEFLIELRDSLKRYSQAPKRIYRYNRHRCYSFELGSDKFNSILSGILNNPVSSNPNDIKVIKDKIDGLDSEYEKSIATAVHYEYLGQIENITLTLENKKFAGQYELSRILYLALAYEKLDRISDALNLLQRITANPQTSNEIRLSAAFNMSVCYEKLEKFENVCYENFFHLNDNLQFSNECIRDKAIANHLIVCHIKKEEFKYESLLKEVLENSLKGSPKLYCKTLLNYLTYKNKGITKEQYDEISELTKGISINTRVGILCEVYMKLDDLSQLATKEEIIEKVERIVVDNNGYATKKHIKELKDYIKNKFSYLHEHEK